MTYNTQQFRGTAHALQAGGMDSIPGRNTLKTC